MLPLFAEAGQGGDLVWSHLALPGRAPGLATTRNDSKALGLRLANVCCSMVSQFTWLQYLATRSALIVSELTRTA